MDIPALVNCFVPFFCQMSDIEQGIDWCTFIWDSVVSPYCETGQSFVKSNDALTSFKQESMRINTSQDGHGLWLVYCKDATFLLLPEKVQSWFHEGFKITEGPSLTSFHGQYFHHAKKRPGRQHLYSL